MQCLGLLIETVSIDEEVIQAALTQARQGSSTFLRDEPHFISDKRRSIIGCDDRYRRYSTQSIPPYSAIGYLAPAGCTAYLVGPRHLITAAHCVHNGTDTMIASFVVAAMMSSACTLVG